MQTSLPVAVPNCSDSMLLPDTSPIAFVTTPSSVVELMTLY